MNKIIFRIAISCLAFWIICPMLQNLIGLEFSDNRYEELYIVIRICGVPLCILLTLFGTINPNDKRGDKIMKAVLTLTITAIAFLFMVMTIFTGMCDWTNREVLYTNKKRKEVKIIQREYGCGAYDSGPAVIKNFRSKKLTKYFILAKEIDVEKIDKNVWIKTEKSKN